MKTDSIIVEVPPAPPSAPPPAPSTSSSQPSSPALFTDKAGRRYFEGKELLIVIDKTGRETRRPLPAEAVGSMAKVWLVRTDDDLIFLFNEPGRVVRLRATPNGPEPFTVEKVFTARIPNTKLLQRVWLDPAGRIVMMYEKNRLAILFPSGRIPRDIATMIPAKELQ